MILNTIVNIAKPLGNVVKVFPRQTVEQCRNYSTITAAVLKDVEKPLEITQIDRPKKIEENEVRIKVQYCCVDTINYKSIEKGKFVPGYEISGEVIEIGENVKPAIAIVGETVAALSLDNYSGFSQECIVNSTDVFRLPGNVEAKKAAVLIYAHSTALYAFSRFCKPPPKEGAKLLISCGSAGFGLAALDIAAGIYKSKVLGVTNTEERAEIMRKQGAFGALSLNETKLKERVLKRMENNEIDIVYDGLGGENLKNMMSCVKLGGTILSVRVDQETIFKPPVNTYFSIVNLARLRIQNNELYRQVIFDTFELADQGVLSPYISSTFPLSKINDAIDFIKQKKSMGKVLIEIK